MENDKKSVLISFIGTNDAGKLNYKNDGAVLTVLKNRKFDEVNLLWTSYYKPDINYDFISRYVKNEIENKKYAGKVRRHYFELDDVVDHNEIYPKLLSFLIKNFNPENVNITAAIASGTPAMQACWILIAESGEFPLELIRSNEPETGKPPISKVKLGAHLPKIKILQTENENLRRSLYPEVVINISKSEIHINNNLIKFSPLEFCYYRYFLNKILKNDSDLKVQGYTMPREFCEMIIEYFEESYKPYDINIRALKKKLSLFENISVGNFRSTVSKLNKKIRKHPLPANLRLYYEITSTGPRFSKSYGLGIPKEKINLIK
ncbi:MAG: hypothetical protein JW917_11740 [Ignavibacteria bacterium]|nr:hypothetical protein [Ignavibacteria bacterium]